MMEWERRPGRRRLGRRRVREHVVKIRLSLDDIQAIAPNLEGSALASWIREAALRRAKGEAPPSHGGTDSHP